MFLYYYPPIIENGTLRKTSDLVLYTRGKILQTISIVRGELVADPFFGVPFRLFTSIRDINADAARLENILKDEIKEADFRVIASNPDQGLFIMSVYWSYLGSENLDSFEVNINE